ncbi:F-box/WD-40 repeat-containing protein At3g52030-like isoform X1 [Castanea sativa]|uniref:F-box/WD-40 repeat-containing protein At3g52030-like isoform X1 n=1 Tax=Castanea sativa TaxID=21020 RepID=UPI003F65373F
MGHTPSSSNDRSERKKRNAKTTIQSLEHDTLCMIFALLDFFDLARCSAVCKYWNTIINKSKMLREFYAKQKQNSADFSNKSTCSETSLKTYLEELAMEHHGFSLQEGLIDIDQWKGHSVGLTEENGQNQAPRALMFEVRV